MSESLGEADSSTKYIKKGSSVICPSCGKEYGAISSLATHYRSKHNDCSGLDCPTCDRSDFISTKGLKQHHAKAHDERLVEKTDCSAECPTCGRTNFKSESGMKLHHYREHGELIGGYTIICDNCGEEDTRDYHRDSEYNFCSNACQGEFLSGEDHHQYKEKVLVKCHTCGEGFRKHSSLAEKVSRHFCDSFCFGEWVSENKSGQNHPIWRGGHATYYGPNWERQRNKARDRDGYRCTVCGVEESKMDRELDVHHLKRIKWFKDNFESPEWYLRGNELDNLMSVCRSCHSEWETIPLRPDCR